MQEPSAFSPDFLSKPLFRTAVSQDHTTRAPMVVYAPHHRCRRRRASVWQLSAADPHLDDLGGCPDGHSRELELGASLSRFHGRAWSPGDRRSLGHDSTLPRPDAAAYGRSHLDAVGAGRERPASHSRRESACRRPFPTVVDTADPSRRAAERHPRITLSANFFEQLVASPVPLDLRAVRILKQSPLALDLYAWATRRVSYLERPTLISWEALRRSFGAGYAETPQGRAKFRAKVLDALRRVCRVYSTLRLEIEDDGVLIFPSAPHIPRIVR